MGWGAGLVTSPWHIGLAPTRQRTNVSVQKIVAFNKTEHAKHTDRIEVDLAAADDRHLAGYGSDNDPALLARVTPVVVALTHIGTARMTGSSSSAQRFVHGSVTGSS